MIKRYYVGSLHLNNTRNVYITDSHGVLLDVLIEYVIGSPNAVITKEGKYKEGYYYNTRDIEFVMDVNVNNKGLELYETTYNEVMEHINYNTLDNN